MKGQDPQQSLLTKSSLQPPRTIPRGKTPNNPSPQSHLSSFPTQYEGARPPTIHPHKVTAPASQHHTKGQDPQQSVLTKSPLQPPGTVRRGKTPENPSSQSHLSSLPAQYKGARPPTIHPHKVAAPASQHHTKGQDPQQSILTKSPLQPPSTIRKGKTPNNPSSQSHLSSLPAPYRGARPPTIRPQKVISPASRHSMKGQDPQQSLLTKSSLQPTRTVPRGKTPNNPSPQSHPSSFPTQYEGARPPTIHPHKVTAPASRHHTKGQDPQQSVLTKSPLQPPGTVRRGKTPKNPSSQSHLSSLPAQYEGARPPTIHPHKVAAPASQHHTKGQDPQQSILTKSSLQPPRTVPRGKTPNNPSSKSHISSLPAQYEGARPPTIPSHKVISPASQDRTEGQDPQQSVPTKSLLQPPSTIQKGKTPNNPSSQSHLSSLQAPYEGARPPTIPRHKATSPASRHSTKGQDPQQSILTKSPLQPPSTIRKGKTPNNPSSQSRRSSLPAPYERARPPTIPRHKVTSPASRHRTEGQDPQQSLVTKSPLQPPRTVRGDNPSSQSHLSSLPRPYRGARPPTICPRKVTSPASQHRTKGQDPQQSRLTKSPLQPPRTVPRGKTLDNPSSHSHISSLLAPYEGARPPTIHNPSSHSHVSSLPATYEGARPPTIRPHIVDSSASQDRTKGRNP
ncbi:proteoglycan 4-like [Dendropsophus ebraccatus]|uniref:proteoglycan 4-like n=1 Tax=Dendropsophus ebraccatus TaxID=150705 RepID=UPI0038316256